MITVQGCVETPQLTVFNISREDDEDVMSDVIWEEKGRWWDQKKQVK